MYSPMRRMNQSVVFFLTFVACLALVTDCRAATNEISIPSTFTHVLLTKQTVSGEIAKCIPGMSQATLSDIAAKFPQSGGITTVENSEGYFVISDANGYCIKKSANNYPILATEAFYKTANPSSEVPTSVTEKWYQEIATLIAKKGTANVAFVFDNGNAVIVDYSVNNTYLVYPHSFKKAGEWESGMIDARFSDKRMQTFDATEYNKKPEKRYLLMHR